MTKHCGRGVSTALLAWCGLPPTAVGRGDKPRDYEDGRCRCVAAGYFLARAMKKIPPHECQIPNERMKPVTARPIGPNS
jgi:hypothetical protein